MQIIIRPVLTEKMTAQGEKLNRFAFIVDRRANKIQIRQAVEDMYGVVVTDVNTVNYMGKEKSPLLRVQDIKSPERLRRLPRALPKSRCSNRKRAPAAATATAR